MYIVGIDIAKRKHEAAVIDGEGAVIIKPFSFTNNCSGYNRLLAMLTKAKLPLDEVSFAMEATGHYWLALFTRLQKEGFRVQVINPVQTNSIRNFYIRQAKTESAGRPAHRGGDPFRTLLRVYPAPRKYL